MNSIDPFHFAAIVESSDDAIVAKSLAGTVISWNPAAERIFGYAAAEIVGQPMTTIFPPARLHEEVALLERVARGERVSHFETERLHKDGHPVQVSVSVSPIRDEAGHIVGVSKIARDIGERLAAERTALHLAHHDALTQLANRRWFLQRLEQEIEQARRERGELSVIYIDLDGFKGVNDRLGHRSGDRLLVAAATRLADAVRSEDLVARLGGDEFTVLLPGIGDTATIAAIEQRLRQALTAPFMLEGQTVELGGSVGSARWPHDGGDADALLHHADQAMFTVKRHRYRTRRTPRH